MKIRRISKMLGSIRSRQASHCRSFQKAQKCDLTPALPSIGTLLKMFHLVWAIRVGVQTIFKQSFSAKFVIKVVHPWKFLFQVNFSNTGVYCKVCSFRSKLYYTLQNSSHIYSKQSYQMLIRLIQKWNQEGHGQFLLL